MFRKILEYIINKIMMRKFTYEEDNFVGSKVSKGGVNYRPKTSYCSLSPKSATRLGLLSGK